MRRGLASNAVDTLPPQSNNTDMKTISISDSKADLEALCGAVASGAAVDPDVLRRVRERAEEVRAELAARGPTDIAVELVRESRENR